MKSAYAPLPFSYLSSDAKPKVGLRKDGVYGTSADVPRIYQPETQDQPQHDAGNISMSTDYPYSVYANASALNPGTAADYRGNYQQQQQAMPSKASADHSLYSQDGPQRSQETTPHRPQKPEGGYLVYPPSKQENPYLARISPKEEDLERRDEPSSDYEYRGLAVAKRPQEPNRSNAVGRVPSHYPPGGNNVYETFNGVESPSTHTMEPQQKQPTAVMSNDNFILVKDPNRPESVVIPEPISSANNDRGRNNNLQTLFEADEPRKQLPRARYNAQPPESHKYNGPSKAESNTRHDHESGFDRPNYAIYNGPQQLGPESVTATIIPEQPIYREDKPGAVQPDSHRSSDARLVKDSEAERNGTSCCVCGKCTAVVIAVIITAIICLGAGFIAGWFGAKATGPDTGKFTSSFTDLSLKVNICALGAVLN